MVRLIALLTNLSLCLSVSWAIPLADLFLPASSTNDVFNVTGDLFNVTKKGGWEPLDPPKCERTGTAFYRPDCVAAINKFPLDSIRDPDPATFSKTSSNPKWKLPQTQLVGSCLAIVELSGLLPTDYSNWREIYAALNYVLQDCIGGGKSGGSIEVGELNGITVSLQPPRAPPPDSNGATNSSLTGVQGPFGTS